MDNRFDPGEIPTTLLQCLADGECRTIDELNELLDLTRRQISDGAAKLVLRDYAERIEIGCYQLTVVGLEAARTGQVISSGPWRPDTVKARKPVKDTFRRRLWNAMRVGGTFTISDLVMAAARPDDTDPYNNTSRYVRHLVKAGYAEELASRQRGTRLTSSGFKRFRLLRNTGPIPPAWSPKRKVLHDYNIREDVPCVSKI